MNLKTLLKQTSLVLLSSIVGLLLLTAVRYIPTNILIDNLAESQWQIGQHLTDTIIDSPIIGSAHSDYYTDSVTLSLASYQSEKGNAFKDAVNNPYYGVFAGEQSAFVITVDAIKKGEVPDLSLTEYGRMWVGSLVIIKPLLVFFNYYQILFIVGLSLTALSILTGFIIYKKRKDYLLFFLLFIFLLNPFILFRNYAYCTSFGIILLTLLLMFHKNRYLNKEKTFILATISGILCQFFDFWSYPLLTLIIPLLFYISLTYQPGKTTFRERFQDMLFYTISWGIGWVFMWLIKWLIYAMTSASPGNVLEKILLRLSASDGGIKISYLGLIFKNFNMMLKATTSVLALLLLFVLIYLLFANKRFDEVDAPIWPSLMFVAHPALCFSGILFLLTKKFKSTIKYGNAIYLFIILAPFIWFAILKNHSFVHAFFVYRLLFTIPLALAFYIYDSAKIFTFLEHENIDENSDVLDASSSI